MTENRSYMIEGEACLQAFMDLLTGRYQLAAITSKTSKISYLDTFDWRIWRRGDVLECRQQNKRTQLVWRTIDYRHTYADIPVDECPDFINDLPDWLQPAELLEITRPRSLIVQALSCVTGQSYEVLGKTDKVVVRLDLISESLRHLNNRCGKALAQRLQIRCIRGYEKDFRKVLKLARKAGLNDYGEDPLVRLLQLNERSPCDYSSQLQLQLDASHRADQVAKQILLKLLQIMQQNEAGIRDDLDTEYLHDFRHAINCSHSLLSQLKHILPADTLIRFDADLVWLEEDTRLLYELNNWLLDFSDSQKRISKKQRPALETLWLWLREQRHAELLRVIALLKGKHYQRFSKRWKVFLECEVPEHSVLKRAVLPVTEVSDRQIWKVYRNLSRYSSEELIDTKSLEGLYRSSRTLHDLLEVSQSLYVADSLKQLQAATDEFLSVVRNCRQAYHKVVSLQGFIKQMQADDRLDKHSEKVAMKLLNKLIEQQTRCQQDLPVSYLILTSGQLRHDFKRLFKTWKPQLTA